MLDQIENSVNKPSTVMSNQKLIRGINIEFNDTTFSKRETEISTKSSVIYI